MKINILKSTIALCTIIITLSGCVLSIAEPIQTESPTVTSAPSIQSNKDQLIKDLKEYTGHWYVKKMVACSRNFSEEYAGKHNLNRKLVISEKKINFDTNSFEIVNKGKFSYSDLMDRFSLPMGSALKICGGEITSEGDVISIGKNVKYFDVHKNNNIKGFILIQKNDGILLVHLGEGYDTNAFYELGRS